MQGPPTVLAHAAPTAAVAAFAVPNTILQQLANIGTSTSLGFMPFASAASVESDRTHLATLFRSNLRVTLLFLGPVTLFLAIFAHRLIAAWINPRFAAHASAPLQLLSIAALLLAMNSAPGDVARGLGHARWIAIYTVSAAAIAIVTSIFLAPHYRAGGVAFALSLALTLTTVPLIALVGTRLLDTSLRALGLALLRPIILLGLLAVLFGAVGASDKSLVVAVLAGALGTLAYAAGAYRYALLDRERAAFRQLGRRVARRGRNA
jgi:O-antigen/teichoic acid export membrane protein